MDVKVRLNESEQTYYQINIGRESYELICEGLNWREHLCQIDRLQKTANWIESLKEKTPVRCTREITNITDDWERWRETLLHMVLNDVFRGQFIDHHRRSLQLPSVATIAPK